MKRERLIEAERLDNALRGFMGQKIIPWADIRDRYDKDKHGFYPEEYYLFENDIRELLSDGLLRETNRGNLDSKLHLSDKGIAVLNKIDQKGYLASLIKSNRNIIIKRILFWIAVVGFIIAVFDSTFNLLGRMDSSNTHTKPTESLEKRIETANTNEEDENAPQIIDSSDPKTKEYKDQSIKGP